MMYVSPYAGLSDREAMQKAVDTAAEKDIRTVLIPANKIWHLEKPVLLPNGVTLILDGAQIHAEGTAFTNANADDDAKLCLGGEQEHIFLVGTKGAVIRGGSGAQIAFRNVKEYGISGITFAGGAGLSLQHCRYGKVQKVRFSGSRYGVFLGEGCNNNLLEDIAADTKEEAVVLSAGETAVWGRSADLYDMVLSRLDAKTEGAPAVAVYAESVVANRLFIRDVTDRTQEGSFAVVLGGGNTELLDLTVRGVKTGRGTVSVCDNCNGVYLGNLQGTAPTVDPKAARVLVDPCQEPVQAPQFRTWETAEYVDANDPCFAASTDTETLQNAIDGAAGKCLVIPRCNARTGTGVWNVEKTLRIPSDTTIVLLDAHLRLADFTYCNLFTNAQKPAKNIRILGVGSATVDSGKFNGLKRKNANTLGFGPITDNALMLFAGVKGLTVENLHMVQNRWYCIFCVDCSSGRLADLDICAHPKFPDMGGIRLHSGCRNVLVENITGLTGEDTVVIAAEPEDEVFAPASATISQIHVRTVKTNASRCNIVTVKANGGGKVHDITLETLLDCSLPEQKKLPFATVQLGDCEGENLSDIRVRDLNGRSTATVQLGGSMEKITISNVHSYGTSDKGIRTLPIQEITDYQMKSVLANLAEMERGYRANIRNLRVNGLFFRCQQASRYMRGTATSIITDKKKFLGTVIELRKLQAEDVLIENVLADRVGNGVLVTGNAQVEIRNFRAAEIGRKAAVCGNNCRLCINDQVIPITETEAL